MRCARAEHKSNSCRCRRSPRCRPPSNDLLPWPGCKSFIYIVHTRTHTYITWPHLRTKRSLTLAAGWCLLGGWLGAASESLAETRRALVDGGRRLAKAPGLGRCRCCCGNNNSSSSNGRSSSSSTGTTGSVLLRPEHASMLREQHILYAATASKLHAFTHYMAETNCAL